MDRKDDNGLNVRVGSNVDLTLLENHHLAIRLVNSVVDLLELERRNSNNSGQPVCPDYGSLMIGMGRGSPLERRVETLLDEKIGDELLCSYH